MKAANRRTLQIVLAVALVAAGVRLLLIYRSRHAAAPEPQKHETPLPADYYVSVKKLHAYDLKTAREVTQQPVWVRDGYRYSYYPFNPHAHRADFDREAGTLAPLEKLQITDVVLNATPRAPLKFGQVRARPNERQLMAVFQKDGKDFAVPIGLEDNGEYQISADEMFYYQDPHDLYKHWPLDVWQAIEQHHVKPGMNELQASFAIGYGIPQPSQGDTKVVNYPNGGHPVEITFRNGRAAEIKR